jgi:hypothetical protein
MAKKRSTSILGSLKKMLHRDPVKPSDPAPKKSTGSRKKPAAPPAEKRAPSGQSAQEQPPATSSADTAAAQGAASEAKPDKKKTPNQPWYRHRQRW